MKLLPQIFLYLPKYDLTLIPECFIILYLQRRALTIKTFTGQFSFISRGPFKGLSASVFIFLSSHGYGGEIDVRTAAEIDWQSRNNVTQSDLPTYCHGRYVDPMLRQPSNTQKNKTSNALDGTANNATYVAGTSVNLEGDVILIGPEREIRAPRVFQDEVTQIAEIDGPLQIREPGLLMTGEHASANIFDGSGAIDSATFLLHQTGFRGSASRLSRDGKGLILLDNATLTRCDPTNNTWAMNTKEIELRTNDGYGIAHNVTLRIKDIPVIYTPYLRFPLGDERLSGFLLPGIGYNSKGGTDIEIPYYFNIAPQMDATYKLRSLWRRGLVHDGQFRWLSKNSVNEINAGFIAKDEIFNSNPISDLTSTTTDTSNLTSTGFTKQNRWFLNVRHKSGWRSNFKSSINFSRVSDTDYLFDIGGDVNSTSVQRVNNAIDSNPSNLRAAALDQIAEFKYRGDEWNAKVLVKAFQNLNLVAAEQYKKLPEIDLGWHRNISGFILSTKINYTMFDKNNDNIRGVLAAVGERFLTEVEISLPLRKPWGYLKPSIDATHRKYTLRDNPTTSRSSPEETTLRASIDSGLYFDRFFNWHGSALQQTLEPRIYLLSSEFDDQDDLPLFDASATVLSYASLFRKNRYAGYDRIADAKQISLGLTSRILKQDNGAEILSASIGQIHYLADRKVNFRTTAASDPLARRSAIFTKARLKLGQKLTVSGSFEWEPEENRSNRGTFSLKYRQGQRKLVNINYIYTAPEIRRPSPLNRSEESDLNFIWPLSRKWSAIGRWNFSWDDNRTIESFAGLEYNDCCWKSRLVVRRFLKSPRTLTILIDDPNSPGNFISTSEVTTPADVGIFFEFQLKGLATVGKRLDSLLEDAIPGYRARENNIGI